MSKKFSGQVIVVTGGSTGIGFAIAAELVKEGAKRVYITGRSVVNLEKASKILGSAVVAFPADVSSLSDLNRLKEEVEGRDGQIDVVFANAGVCKKNIFGETVEGDYEELFDINVKGVFFTCQTLLPLIKDGGAMVLTSSTCSSNGLAELSLYNASKAAVRSFARTWTNDLRARKIRVNALSPGFTRTPLMDDGLNMSESEIENLKDFVSKSAPLGYMAQPEEIATAALFLASNDAKYITGVELFVDGGIDQI